jgi:GTP cyclohydrolase I
METVYLSLGSNMGNRRSYLQKAAAQLAAHPAIRLEQVSNIYETSPVGQALQNNFLNLALRISTSLQALELLTLIEQIEQELGRERLVHWGPRTADIDILYFGDLTMESPRLTLPHKEIFNRLFVLIPLSELINAHFKDFVKIKKTITELENSGQEIKIYEN